MVNFDEESLNYLRFMTHIQFFAQRITQNNILSDNESFLFEQIKSAFPRAFETALKIKKFVESNYDFTVSKEELVYLTVHIQRITM